MGNALEANPAEVKEQYERQLKVIEQAYAKAMRLSSLI